MRLAAIGVDLSRHAYFDALAPIHTNMAHSGIGLFVRVRFKDLADDHYAASRVVGLQFFRLVVHQPDQRLPACACRPHRDEEH